VTRQGLTIRKKSAALLQVIQLYSPKDTYDAIYLKQLRHHQRHRPLSRIPRRRPGDVVRPLDYSLRVWLDRTS